MNIDRLFTTSSSVVRAVQTLSHASLRNSLGVICYYLHLTDEVTEAQKGSGNGTAGTGLIPKSRLSNII